MSLWPFYLFIIQNCFVKREGYKVILIKYHYLHLFLRCWKPGFQWILGKLPSLLHKPLRDLNPEPLDCKTSPEPTKLSAYLPRHVASPGECCNKQFGQQSPTRWSAVAGRGHWGQSRSSSCPSLVRSASTLWCRYRQWYSLHSHGRSCNSSGSVHAPGWRKIEQVSEKK